MIPDTGDFFLNSEKKGKREKKVVLRALLSFFFFPPQLHSLTLFAFPFTRTCLQDPQEKRVRKEVLKLSPLEAKAKVTEVNNKTGFCFFDECKYDFSFFRFCFSPTFSV